MRSHRRSRGTVMVLVVILSTVIAGLVLTLAWSAAVQAQGVAAQVRMDRAFYAAEAGLQVGVWKFKHDNTYRAMGGAPFTGAITLGSDTYNYSFTCVDEVGTSSLAWKFDEGVGFTTADSSGNGNTGTLHGGVTWTTDARSGNALLFDGATGYVDCGNNASTNITGDITFSAWVKQNGAYYDQKVGANQNGTFGGYKLCVYNNKLEFEVRDANNTAWLNRNLPGGTTLVQGTWYHIVGVYSESNHWIKTYVDGAEELSRRYAGIPANSLGTTAGTFIIGREPFDDTLYFWNGIIDDIRIYNRCLSDQEIASLYDTTVDLHCTATYAGVGATASSSTAAVSVGIPTPPPPKAPSLTTGNDISLNNVTFSGDLQCSGSVTATGTASTMNGNLYYGSGYTPNNKITFATGYQASTLNTTPPVISYASIQGQATKIYNGSQNGTTFNFSGLGGNKIIYVNGNVTDPQFAYTGAYPSGGTLLINGSLTFTQPATIGSTACLVYVICEQGCSQSSNAATLTLYGGLYINGNWDRRQCTINGIVSVNGTITDNAGMASTFTNGAIPWFDPRASSGTGQASLPVYYLNFHDDNP